MAKLPNVSKKKKPCLRIRCLFGYTRGEYARPQAQIFLASSQTSSEQRVWKWRRWNFRSTFSLYFFSRGYFKDRPVGTVGLPSSSMTACRDTHAGRLLRIFGVQTADGAETVVMIVSFVIEAPRSGDLSLRRGMSIRLVFLWWAL
jgi:hypothetical protein